VNYLWKILSDLNIPYATLLDLDLARFGGGWGRIKYAREQLQKIGVNVGKGELTKWDAASPLRAQQGDDPDLGLKWMKFLGENGVFYSKPLDLDFSMLVTYPDAYDISTKDQEAPDEATCRSVLGKSHADENWYSRDEKKNFDDYHQLFKVGSKPAAHIEALSNLEIDEINSKLPEQYRELIDYVATKLQEVFE